MQDLILVAGAGGFVGGHLVRELLAQGRRVRAADIKPTSEWFQHHAGAENLQLDLRELSACERACAGAAAVYNFACDMGGMGFIESNKAACMVSVLTNTNLLRAGVARGVGRHFFASSVCVYNTELQKDLARPPLVEHEAYPALPDDGYGWEKLFSERMCHHFAHDHGIKTRVARYQPVYGPKGAWEGGRERAPAAICRKVIHAKVAGKHEIEIWGDGSQTRSFMYVEDCIRGTQMLLNSDVAEPINMGPRDLVSINELVSTAEAIAGIRLKRNYKLDAPTGVGGRRIDNCKLVQTFKWEPSTTFLEGMEKTYASIYDEYVKKYGTR
jgi:GDP-D-mannose 3', 5'-epimerase